MIWVDAHNKLTAYKTLCAHTLKCPVYKKLVDIQRSTKCDTQLWEKNNRNSTKKNNIITSHYN